MTKPAWSTREIPTELADKLDSGGDTIEANQYQTWYTIHRPEQPRIYHNVPNSLILFHVITWTSTERLGNWRNSFLIWTKLLEHSQPIRPILLLAAQQYRLGEKPPPRLSFLLTRVQATAFDQAISLMSLGSLLPPQEQLVQMEHRRRGTKRRCPDRIFLAETAQTVNCPNRMLLMQLIQNLPREEYGNYPPRVQITMTDDDEVAHVWFPAELLALIEPVIHRWDTWLPVPQSPT